MSKGKLEQDKRNYKVYVHFASAENEEIKQYADACGLSMSELLRQICMGYVPQPKPEKEFWELLKMLYEVHESFKMCVSFYPMAIEICKGIEDFIINLQQIYTTPRKIDVDELIRKGGN